MKISVIIPVYNVERYIGKCIGSVLTQSLSDIEVVVVNDASPDRSMEIVREFAASDHRIVIVDNAENCGLMWTRKVGYQKARGDYFVFCDSDDYLPTDALEILYNEIIRTDSEIVAGNITYIPCVGERREMTSALHYGNDPEAVYKSLLKGEFTHNLVGKIYKRSIFTGYEYAAYKQFTNAEDACLFYQLVNNTQRITCIDHSVYYYMQNTQSSSQVRLSERALENIVVANRFTFDLISRYSTLDLIMNQAIIKSFMRMLRAGYSKKTIGNLAEKHEMSRFLQIDYIKKYLSKYELIIALLCLNFPKIYQMIRVFKTRILNG